MTTAVVALCAGLVLARLGLIDGGGGRALETVAIRVALPGLILHRLAHIDLSGWWLPAVAAWLSAAGIAAAVYAIGRIRSWDRRTLGTLLVVVPLGNTSFIGLPVVEGLLGRDHLPGALVFDQLGSFLLVSTWGIAVAAVYSGAPGTSPASVARRVLGFPPFVALVAVVALGLAGMAPPAGVTGVARSLGACLTPLVMTAIGVRMALMSWSAPDGVERVGLFLKLVGGPALVWVLVAAGGWSGPGGRVSVLEAAMPPMVSAAVVVGEAGLDGDRATRLVGWGAVLSVLTLPAWWWVVR